MSNISFEVVIPGKSSRSVIQTELKKDFRIGTIDIISGDKRHIYLTELMEGNTPKFLPWKQSLTALNLLVGQLLKKNTIYKLTFINTGAVENKLSVKISGNYIS